MITRRETLMLGAGALAALAADPPGLPKICIFSKHLQWLSMPDAAGVAAEIGFDGVDITVRDGGHVEPARVEADLPRAVDAVRRAGLEVPMITAGIVDARSAHAEAILRTASALKIRRYRWGGLTLDSHRSIPEQIDNDRGPVRELAALNKQYGMCAMYHTHSGAEVMGASIWDLYLLLRDMDSSAVGINYDIGHATVEGGLGGWRNSTSLSAPLMRGVAMKDFYWAKDDKGAWTPRWCAIGKGMVNFDAFFGYLREVRFSGPFQLHFEYPEMGGADGGNRALGISRQEFIARARGDLNAIRERMRSAGLDRAA